MITFDLPHYPANVQARAVQAMSTLRLMALRRRLWEHETPRALGLTLGIIDYELSCRE